MYLTYPEFEHNTKIPARHTCCEDSCVRPPLEIGDLPPQTRSFALVVEDFDVSDGSWNFLHWMAWNIEFPLTNERSQLTEIIEGWVSLDGYHNGAPCPTDGIHRYRFKLFSLDNELGISRDSEIEELREEMYGHVLAEAEHVGTYHCAEGEEWKRLA